MSKIQNFAEITPNLPFSEFNFYELYRATFENSELGRMKEILLLREMAEAWKPYMKNLDTMFTDATCYESEIRYPTDQRLLYECVEKGNERAFVHNCLITTDKDTIQNRSLLKRPLTI